MDALAISLAVCLILVGGALAGALLRRLLPEHQLDGHAKDIVRLGCALIATISGLVLGLLINSAKTNFDTRRDEIRLLAADVILLDHVLQKYGSEARPARAQLREVVASATNRIWNEEGRGPAHSMPFIVSSAGGVLESMILSLAPATDVQRTYKAQALQALGAIVQARLILFEQSRLEMPAAFLVVLVFWLFVLFVSFSLFSPLNITALVAIVVIALSAAGTFYLILELYQPFDGLMQIDRGPLRHALPSLGA